MNISQQVIACLIGIDRSLIGNGVKHSLEVISLFSDIEIHSLSSGSIVEDWQIPMNWIINNGSISDPDNGEEIVSHRDSFLRVVKHSESFFGTISFEQLKKHLFVGEEHIPYRTSYYSKKWGFCINNSEYVKLSNKPFLNINLDTIKVQGELYYGEYLLRGISKKEILITSYICHPNLVNDNLSGIASLVQLMNFLGARESLNYSYRFLIIPETIGSISWLANNKTNNIVFGLNLHCMSGVGPITFKKSPRNHSLLNHLISEYSTCIDTREFEPFGSDERQFSTNASNLDFGTLSRTPFGEFPEYHKSSDSISNYNLECHKQIDNWLSDFILKIDTIDAFTRFDKKTKGEIFLSKYNLYRSIGGVGNGEDIKMKIINWLLFLSQNSFVSAQIVALKLDVDIHLVNDVIKELVQKKLLY